MSLGGSFLAVDWGTTNRRVYRVQDGLVVHSERDARGVTATADFPAEAAALRARHGDLPMVMAGMVGSTIGWREAPYVPAPAGFDELAAALLWIDPRTAIVPGVCVTGPADVMRGEEVQLLGAVAAGLVPADALLAQPGTHCKWARMQGGRIAGFTTAMTGELFALLRGTGILAAQLSGNVSDGPAFIEGVREGGKRDLAASLFGIRAAKLLGERGDADAASYASGLLIGADVAARLADAQEVHVLADPVLGGLYCTAIQTLGGGAALIDSHDAFLSGIMEIARR